MFQTYVTKYASLTLSIMFLSVCIMYDHHFTVYVFICIIHICMQRTSSASAAMFSLNKSIFFFFKVYHMQLPIMITDINNKIITSTIFIELIKK